MIAFVVGPTDPATESRFPGVAELPSSRLPRQFRRSPIQVNSHRPPTHTPPRTDRVCPPKLFVSTDVRPRLEVFPVNIQHHIRPRPRQILVAPFKAPPCQNPRRSDTAAAASSPSLHRAPVSPLRRATSRCLRRFVQIKHEQEKLATPYRTTSCIGGHRQNAQAAFGGYTLFCGSPESNACGDGGFWRERSFSGANRDLNGYDNVPAACSTPA